MHTEVLRDKTVSKFSDMWALGVVAIELYTRSVPFPNITAVDV
jgi:serine/threonine protein kinase